MTRFVRDVAGLFVLYLILVGQTAAAELGAAVLGALLAGGFAAWVRRCGTRHILPRAPWGRIIRGVAAALIADPPAVGAALLRTLRRPVVGRIQLQPFDPGGHTPVATARRGLVVLAASVAPNSYVVNVTEGALLMHRLLPRPPSPDRKWVQ